MDLRWPAGRLAAAVAHFGHVHARSSGGSCRAENLRIICASCNLAMGVTHMHRFRATPPAPTEHYCMDIDQVGGTGRCLGVTRSGPLCRNRALAQNAYCAVHAGRISPLQ